MSKCLINVDGGMGKNVMLTSILPIVAEKYDEIYVVSPYFDIFKACSYVTDAFAPGQPTLYQELVLDDDCDILWDEPYNNSRFIKKQCHLFDAWLEEFGIERPEGFAAMDLVPVIDKIEDEFPIVAQARDKALQDIGNEKFILVQFSGGQSPLSPMQDQNGNMIPYPNAQEAIKRNYTKAQQLITQLKAKYPDVAIVHYALPNEPSFDGTIKLQVPYLTYRLLAEKAFKVICIDSSLQHLATGVCKDITVIWGETRPEHFGYSCNKNICAKHVLNSQPYFKPLGVSPSIVNMPKPEEILAEQE